MNRQMDRMPNEFGDKLNRLEKKLPNDYGGVQNRLEKREFNVRRVVRRFNINLDEFVTDNTEMDNVNFDNVYVGHKEQFREESLV